MIKLPIFHLNDFSKLSKNDNVRIEIIKSTFSFSPDAKISGTDERNNPIFGSKIYINDILTSTMLYGLPTLLFPQGSAPLINFVNNTNFTTNLHFHGLVNTGLVDGASSFGVFGPSTSLGSNINIQLPIIKNNSALTWYHSHVMFRSVELLYSGLVGVILVTDPLTQQFNNFFTYGDNHIVLNCMDMDFDSDGCQTYTNLPVDGNRSCFTVVNGISAVQWYTNPTESVPYTNILKHITNQNIVKIDILNSNGDWRVFYLGVCDNNKNIIPFYVIQTDQGLCAPVRTTIQFIPVGGRISILINLSNVEGVYLFFYDYDLTENFDINSDGTGTFPDFTHSSSTPYPSPIPNTNNNYQEESSTNLTYPLISKIRQKNQIMINGYCPIPNTSSIRPFLYITNTSATNNLSVTNILDTINNIIYKNGVPVSNSNYIRNLNSKYYYNIPDVSLKTPKRTICLWGETDINYIQGGSGNTYIVDNTGKNVYGITEYCNGANRIYADLWNSSELDLNQALIAYSNSPNNYKPNVLPTSDFRVTQTNDNYINIAMISNDTFVIEGFQNNILYGDYTSVPAFSVSITLPPTNERVSLNIQEWIDLLNKALASVNITEHENTFTVASILSFDWSFFPYGINLLDGTTTYLKSAVIKTKNNSKYCLRLLGRWSILQLMGKSMIGCVNLTPPTPGSGPCCSVDSPCDEEQLYGVYDNYIQAWYPYYATDNIDIQNPILCPRRNAQLIIASNQTYIGLYDGFANDNLNSFATKLRSTEIWTYLNGDTADAHPLHFHLTSGFAYQTLTNSNDKIIGLTHAYSRDIYQIGPQKTLSFAITWPYYSSEDVTSSPYIPNIGSVIHCHLLSHNDANSMMLGYSVKPASNFICNMGFLAGTYIKTDQGAIPIETLLPNIHTFRNKKIIDIVKTISLKKYLVCFEKDSLGDNVPSQKTFLSKNHKLFYKGNMVEAIFLIGLNDKIYKVNYEGQILYNVLMKKYNTMLANNIICETLHPKNSIAKINKLFKNLNSNEYEKLIKKYNLYYIQKTRPNLDE